MHLDDFHIIYSLCSCLNWKCLSLICIQTCVHKPPSLDIIHCMSVRTTTPKPRSMTFPFSSCVRKTLLKQPLYQQTWPPLRQVPRLRNLARPLQNQLMLLLPLLPLPTQPVCLSVLRTVIPTRGVTMSTAPCKL